MLLPYREQGPISHSINFVWTYPNVADESSPNNSTACYTKIAAILCPPDFNRLTTPYGPQQLHGQHATLEQRASTPGG